MSSKNISIVGAGLVGSLWAVILKKRGYNVKLFEKRKDIRKISSTEDRSINLIITSRGLKGLEEAGLLNEALALSVPVYGRMIHSRTGETQYQPYGKANECNYSISRAELNKFLLTAAEKNGVNIFYEHELSNLDVKNKTLTFKNVEKNYTYDLLFATDGVGSPVRKTLCEKFPNDFSEHIDWLEADYKELFMPADPGGKYKVEKNALHIWPRGGHMLMALANLDGSFTMTLYMPHEDSPKNKFNFKSVNSKEKVDHLFAEDFKDAISLMPDYARDFLSRPEGKLGTLRCNKWCYEDSIVLMGDAAHAILPFFGQGMNCGFEDCTNFLKILDENNGDFKKSIPEYEKVQRPNAHAIAEMAIENWTEMRDKVGDPKFLFRKKVEALLEKEFPKLYKSRYGMVTYTLIPYAIAREVGFIQDKILTQICNSAQTLEEISLAHVQGLLNDHLAPFIKMHNLDL